MSFTGAFWDQIDHGTDYAEVEHHLLDLTRDFGVTAITAMEIRRPGRVPALGQLFGKTDGVYARRYRKEDLAASDVAARHALQSEEAFAWDDVRTVHLSRSETRVFDIAREHGLGDGYIVPNHGRGCAFGIASFYGSRIDTSPLARRTLAVTGAVFYRFASRLARTDPKMQAENLTNRHREVLHLSASGQSNSEMAKTLGLAEATINSHMETAKDRLGARTRTEAVAIALGRGLIDAP